MKRSLAPNASMASPGKGSCRPDCPVCGGRDLETIIQRQAPIHQNLLIADQAEAKALPRGELNLTICLHCGFVFNRAFDLALLRYGAAYDSNQDASGVFNAHVADRVNYLLNVRGIRNSAILEIGCGKGQFLEALVADPALNNTGFGFDPSYNGPEACLDGRLRFSQNYYGPGCENIAADVVICRHVLGHLPEPVAMLRTVRQALVHSPQARLFFETPSVDWMFANRVNWDFFYEYCAYFSPASLQTACANAGFRVEQIQPVFGGQYLWIEASILPEGSPAIAPADPKTTVNLARPFSEAVAIVEQSWRERLSSLDGPIALWGAGAKGCTFANLLDPDACRIDCVIDLNPRKQNRFLPGTGHPIVSAETAAARGVKSAILLNPNYHDEIEALLRERGLDIALQE